MVYLNGEFLSAGDAKVSVFDGAWLHGAGLFETMRAENGRVFRLQAHLERLRRSAERLLQPLERKSLPSVEACEELLRRNGLDSARLRLTVSAGSMLERLDSANDRPLTVCMTAQALIGHPAQAYESGIQVAICPFLISPTDPIVQHKTTSYLPRLLGLREAQRARCIEALWFTTRHHLAEGSISNVFLASKGILQTPPLDTPVLPGITRAVVLELARRLKIETRECELTIHDLLDADEVFLTNAIMQLMPVVRVEKSEIAGARVGDIARTLMRAYRDLVKEECGG